MKTKNGDGDSGPLKPDRPLASIVFSKRGKVSRHIEHLPRIKKTLELAIAQKFVHSLEHFWEIELTGVTQAEGQGDFLVCKTTGSPILVQITEVVSQQMREINEQRSTYTAHILEEYSSLLEGFSGCRLIITDDGVGRTLPQVDSKHGQANLSDIAKSLGEMANGISSLELGKIRVRRYGIEPSKTQIIVTCERLRPPNAGFQSIFNWTGGYVPDPTSYRDILAERVRAKIDLGYEKPAGEYWLLLYSSDILPMSDSPEVAEAANVLEATTHPFDQVWFLFPYPNQDLGHLVKIWPKEKAA